MTTETSGAPAQAATDSARIELTGFELLALLSLNPGEASSSTRTALRLPDVPDDSPLANAGFSSLIIRGLAVAADGVVAPAGNVIPMTRILTTAESWVEAVGVVGETTNAALLVAAPSGSVVLEPRPYGIWYVWPLSPEDTLVDAAVRYVRASFDNLTGRPFAASIKVTDAAGTRSSAVRVAEDESWELASGPEGAELTPAPVAADPSFQVLAEALA
ncbi:hypothetical protein [Antribacter gilvus]|uniref:hypothetical protein n=1 Tax=Antribacter gilvus TaxID=2304675 RepID=UPI000F7AF816|nr:hypothetical protein [Antribacter gilvus]